jgi:O-antigen/teichoic acid export membrane protein
MNHTLTHWLRPLLGGTGWTVLVQAISLPIALIIGIVLARWLSLESYGLYVLSSIIILWSEWTVLACLSQAGVRLIGEADDWRPVGATIVRFTLLLAGAATVLIWLAAGSLEAIFDAPGLAHVLRLFALDIVPFCLLQSYQRIQVGRGRYRRSAWLQAALWGLRLVLVCIFLLLWPETSSVVLGFVLAPLLLLLLVAAIDYEAARVLLPGVERVPWKAVYQLAAPLLLYNLGMRLYIRSDLIALKLLGGSLEQAGIYGAVQNLAQVLVMVTNPLFMLLLSTLVRMKHTEDTTDAVQMVMRLGLRAVCVLLSFAALAAGMAPQLAGLIYGPAFTAGGTALALLFLRSSMLVIVSMCITILIAAGAERQVAWISGVLFLVSLAGYAMLLPWAGLEGAAAAQLIAASATLLIVLWRLYAAQQVTLPAATLARSILIGTLVFVLGVAWPVEGALLLIKLFMLGGLIPLAYLALGELQQEDQALLSAMLRRSSATV